MSAKVLKVIMISLMANVSLLAAPSAENGKKLYASCVQCHGEQGMGNPAEQAPKIAGQYDWYIISSIKAFKEGKERQNPKMLPYIKNLSEQEIIDLAAYISTMGQ